MTTNYYYYDFYIFNLILFFSNNNNNNNNNVTYILLRDVKRLFLYSGEKQFHHQRIELLYILLTDFFIF